MQKEEADDLFWTFALTLTRATIALPNLFRSHRPPVSLPLGFGISSTTPVNKKHTQGIHNETLTEKQ